eukprot:265336-Prorocentrum_minimum.AAC.8
MHQNIDPTHRKVTKNWDVDRFTLISTLRQINPAPPPPHYPDALSIKLSGNSSKTVSIKADKPGDSKNVTEDETPLAMTLEDAPVDHEDTAADEDPATESDDADTLIKRNSVNHKGS